MLLSEYSVGWRASEPWHRCQRTLYEFRCWFMGLWASSRGWIGCSARKIGQPSKHLRIGKTLSPMPPKRRNEPNMKNPQLVAWLIESGNNDFDIVVSMPICNRFRAVYQWVGTEPKRSALKTNFGEISTKQVVIFVVACWFLSVPSEPSNPSQHYKSIERSI